MNIRTVLAAAAITMLPFAVSAATMTDGGGPYDLSAASEYTYTTDIEVGNLDAADNKVVFTFTSGGVPGATAFSVILDAFDTFVTELKVSWSGGSTETTTGVGGIFILTGVTTAFPPDPQTLTVSWTGSPTGDQGALLNVEVGAVPLPAAGFLLLGGLGGLAAMKRRKKA